MHKAFGDMPLIPYYKLFKPVSMAIAISILATSIISIPMTATADCANGVCTYGPDLNPISPVLNNSPLRPAPNSQTGCTSGSCAARNDQASGSQRSVDGFSLQNNNNNNNNNSATNGGRFTGGANGLGSTGNGLFSKLRSMIGPMMTQLLPIIVGMLLQNKLQQNQQNDALRDLLRTSTPVPTYAPQIPTIPVQTATPSFLF